MARGAQGARVSGPPDDVAPSELWRRLSEAPAPSEVFPFPRKGLEDLQIRIFCLRMEAHDTARLTARAKLTGAGIDSRELDNIALREVYGDATAREILALAVHHPDPIPGSELTGAPKYARVWLDADQIKRQLSADEILVLFTLWQMVQRRFGPHEASVTSEKEISAWIERLKDGANAYPLALLDWHRLVELTTCLARRASELSGHLESLRSNWPPTSVSRLERLVSGTTSYGKPHAATSQNGSGDAPPAPPMTAAEAASLAERIWRHGLNAPERE